MRYLWLAASTGVAEETASSSGDVWAVLLFGAVVAFFAWLLVAAVRRKLGNVRGRLGDLTEDEREAADNLRLWAEARRRTADEDEDEAQEESGAEEPVPLQEELLQKSRERLDARQAPARNVLLENLPPAPPAPEPPRAQEPAPAPAPPAPAVPEPTEPASPSPQPLVAPAPVPPPSPSIAPVPAPPPVERPRSLEDGLLKTREGVFSRLGRLFGRKQLGAEDLEQVEEILFTADIGVRTSQKLIDFVQEELSRKELSDSALLFAALRERVREILTVPSSAPEVGVHRPHVILVVGVNGTGKTTTIGKLALQHSRAGRKVILAAGDTFRAAAAEQLTVWGERAGAQVIRGQEGADPASVVFDAISAARSQQADVVIADTAGRLHTRVNLVEELRKVHRVCGKAMEGAPHEVLLVLDATTGQNAINQAKEFHSSLNVTGIVLTKLDGTAKGGVIIGICDTFGIPVRYIGIGEQVEDLRPFEPEPFVKALFS